MTPFISQANETPKPRRTVAERAREILDMPVELRGTQKATFGELIGELGESAREVRQGLETTKGRGKHAILLVSNTTLHDYCSSKAERYGKLSSMLHALAAGQLPEDAAPFLSRQVRPIMGDIITHEKVAIAAALPARHEEALEEAKGQLRPVATAIATLSRRLSKSQANNR